MNAYTKIGVLTATAATVALVAGATQASSIKGPKEKCYGIALAGENDCGNLSGTHSCQGQATTSFAVDEWNFVPKGACASTVVKGADGAEHKGLSKAEAKAAMAG